MRRRSFIALASAFAAGTAFRPTAGHAARSDDRPLQITVSIRDQSLAVYRGTEQIDASPVSTGKQGHATPLGIFSVLDKRIFHRSNIYSNAPMPHMQRLTWSGIALHASNHVPRHPASHGCVRLPAAFAKSLYSMTGFHDHVVIADAPVAPRPIAHGKLFQPFTTSDLMAGSRMPLRLRPLGIGDDEIEVASAGASMEIMSDASEKPASAPIRMLITRRTHNERIRDVQSILNLLGFGAGAVDGFAGRLTIAALKAFQREAGMATTGMATRDVIARLHKSVGRDVAAAHLYVRRDFEPVFDVPVALDRPELPMGAHRRPSASFPAGKRNGRRFRLPTARTDPCAKTSRCRTTMTRQAPRSRARSTGWISQKRRARASRGF
jgi:peptidoglycan hydrolase-like protein with peptidoglycan-binding domain